MSRARDKGVSDRISSLESWREDTNRRLDDFKDDLNTLNNKVDTMRSNELKHITDRIATLENEESGSISKGDWAKIIIAMITTAGLMLAAFIQYVVGK